MRIRRECLAGRTVAGHITIVTCPNSYAHTNTNSYANSHSHAHPNTDSNTHPNTHPYADTNTRTGNRLPTRLLG